MATPIDQKKFETLPKWAQDHIRTLDSERVLAVRQLNEYLDEQKESKMWIDDLVCTGETQGPSYKRRYIQHRRINFMVGSTEVRIGLDLRDEKHLQINCGGRQMVFQPTASNAIEIIDQS